MRSQQNDDETNLRLQQNAERNRILRSQENDNETTLRLQHQADRNRIRRSQEITNNITLLDIENAQLREIYQFNHPIDNTDITYRNHRVLTPQEFEVNNRIDNIRNNVNRMQISLPSSPPSHHHLHLQIHPHHHHHIIHLPLLHHHYRLHPHSHHPSISTPSSCSTTTTTASTTTIHRLHHHLHHHHHHHRHSQLPNTHNIARQYTIDELTNDWDNFMQHTIYWRNESKMHSLSCFLLECMKETFTRPYSYTKCCNKGKIVLPPISQPTPYMRRLLIHNRNDIEANLFNKKARIFNSKLSFASITFNDVNRNLQGIPAMRIQGQIYHNIGTIHPIDNTTPQFMQCFFYEHNNNDNVFYTCMNGLSCKLY